MPNETLLHFFYILARLILIKDGVAAPGTKMTRLRLIDSFSRASKVQNPKKYTIHFDAAPGPAPARIRMLLLAAKAPQHLFWMANIQSFLYGTNKLS
jgi:hypothetical protein